MKSAPEFNEAEAREEVLDFVKRSYEGSKQQSRAGKAVQMTLEEHVSQENKWIEASINEKRRNWPREWRRRQIEKGRCLLEDWMRTLSEDDRELVEEYLSDARDRAEADGYESGAYPNSDNRR